MLSAKSEGDKNMGGMPGHGWSCFGMQSLPNENENVLATPPCQSSLTHGTSRNPIHVQTYFHRIRQEDRAGSSPFGVCLYLQDGDCEFLAVFRCKIKGDKQGAEHRKVRLFVHSNYTDYDSLAEATDYDKNIMFGTTTRQ